MPLSVLIYYFLPRPARPAALALLSVAFMLLHAPTLALCACLAVAGSYLCAWHIYRSRFSMVRRRSGLILGFAICAGAFAGYAQGGGKGPGLLMLATVVLSAFSYLMDLYRGEDDKLHRFDGFALYCLFFGRLLYGPLVRADEFVVQLGRIRASARQMAQGLLTFFIGLAQVLVLSSSLHTVEAYMAGVPTESQSLLIVASRVLLVGLGWYFRISGYSNMAQGTGLLFGIDLPRNHAYPFGATSIGSYYGRFLITQNSYARTYIAPLLGGGEQVGSGNPVAVVVSSVFAGLWFGLPGGALWGALFGVLIYLERLAFGSGSSRRRASYDTLRRAVVFLVGALSFVLLLPGSMSGYFSQLQTMVASLGGLPAYTQLSFYMLLYFLPLIITALVFATRLLRSASEALKSRTPAVYSGAVLLWGLAMMAICLSTMIQDGGWAT